MSELVKVQHKETGRACFVSRAAFDSYLSADYELTPWQRAADAAESSGEPVPDEETYQGEPMVHNGPDATRHHVDRTPAEASDNPEASQHG